MDAEPAWVVFWLPGDASTAQPSRGLTQTCASSACKRHMPFKCGAHAGLAAERGPRAGCTQTSARSEVRTGAAWHCRTRRADAPRHAVAGIAALPPLRGGFLPVTLRVLSPHSSRSQAQRDTTWQTASADKSRDAPVRWAPSDRPAWVWRGGSQTAEGGAVRLPSAQSGRARATSCLVRAPVGTGAAMCSCRWNQQPPRWPAARDAPAHVSHAIRQTRAFNSVSRRSHWAYPCLRLTYSARSFGRRIGAGARPTRPRHHGHGWSAGAASRAARTGGVQEAEQELL